MCLHVTDGATFLPYRTTVTLLWLVRRLWPRELAWRQPPYEYETVKLPIDILTGGTMVRDAIDAQRDLPSTL